MPRFNEGKSYDLFWLRSLSDTWLAEVEAKRFTDTVAAAGAGDVREVGTASRRWSRAAREADRRHQEAQAS